MHQFLAFQVTLIICASLFCCREGKLFNYYVNNMCVIKIPCYLVYYGHGGKFSCSYNFILVHNIIILGASVRLSPLGMVSVCSGGQVLLTCERISGSFLFWTVSIPRLAIIREVIVPGQGISVQQLCNLMDYI